MPDNYKQEISSQLGILKDFVALSKLALSLRHQQADQVNKKSTSEIDSQELPSSSIFINDKGDETQRVRPNLKREASTKEIMIHIDSTQAQQDVSVSSDKG